MSTRFVNDRKAPRQPTSAVASADQAVPGTGPRLRAAENELERLKDKLRQMEMNTGCIHSPQPTRLGAAESGIETLKSSLGHMEMNTGTALVPNPDTQKNSGLKPGIQKNRIHQLNSESSRVEDSESDSGDMEDSESDSGDMEDSESDSGQVEVEPTDEIQTTMVVYMAAARARAAEASAEAAEASAEAAAKAWRNTSAAAKVVGDWDEDADELEEADDLARDVAVKAAAWARKARAEAAEARAEARAAEERAGMNVFRDAHATPSAPEAPQRTTGTVFRVPNAHKTKLAIETWPWDGIIVDQPTTVYACHQQTFFAQTARENWIGKQNVQNYSLRLSMPPFNKAPPGLKLDGHAYEIPVYGLKISNAIMNAFNLLGVRELANELGVTLPSYELSKFVQGKMHKVRKLIEEARKRDDCKSGVNADAISRLERFVEAFVLLSSEQIDGPDAWHGWVSSFTADDWMEKQEFSDLLSNFGFSPTTAKELRVTEIDDKQDDGSFKKATLEQYSLRWLSKAFAGYNVVGCLTDVANLIFAMKGPSPATKPTEQEVVAGLGEVVARLTARNLEDIWIPTHMIHDAESDDMLAWLLLVYVHHFPQLETVAERLEARGCEIYRDASSRNAKAIKLAYDNNMMMPI